jgi:ribonucleoside-diphosphate reductase alpha chain
MGATHAEKSTSKAGALNAVSSSGTEFSAAADTTAQAAGADPSGVEAKFCSIDNPECEACQ